MKNLLAVLVLALPFTVSAQADKAVAPFVAPGWKVIATAEGDLNKDGTNDMALVIENTDKASFIQNPHKGFDPEVFNTNPRKLLVLFKNASGSYTLADSNDGLIPPQHDPEMPCGQDPFLDSGEMIIDNGVLHLTLQSNGSCGNFIMSLNTYTFRYQEGSFKLIGFDFFMGDKPIDQIREISINYLTKKKSTTTGEHLTDMEASNPKTTWEKVTIAKLFSLAELKYDIELRD